MAIPTQFGTGLPALMGNRAGTGMMAPNPGMQMHPFQAAMQHPQFPQMMAQLQQRFPNDPRVQQLMQWMQNRPQAGGGMAGWLQQNPMGIQFPGMGGQAAPGAQAPGAQGMQGLFGMNWPGMNTTGV